MSTSMEQSTTAPKRPRNRAPRKEGSRILQHAIGDVIITPNSKNNHEDGRSHSMADIISPPSLLDQVIPSIQALEIDSRQNLSTQKKKRNYKKKNGDRIQPEQARYGSQSPPTERPALQATPVKAVQMYAGPTFHSSPAASSLPMPKFFTQSMKSAKASESIQTISDESSGESSSQNGGDSPTMKSSLKVLGNAEVRESSPLDIFFNADRQEKAQKARLESNLAQERAKSASPGIDRFRSPPLVKPTTPSTIDGNYAKTLALKQLLLFPKAQSRPQTTESVSSSPFLDIQYRPGVGRSTSETSTPTRSSINSNETSVGKRPFYDSPNLSTPPSSARGNQTRRPLPHHLRQEFLNSLPLDQSPDILTKTGHFAPKSRA